MGDKRPGADKKKETKKKKTKNMETDAKKKEKYISPELKMERFALEKGFAVSVMGDTDYLPEGSTGSAYGQFDEGEDLSKDLLYF